MRRFAAAALLAALALAGCSPAPLSGDPEPEAGTGTSDQAATAETEAASDPELDAFRSAIEDGSPADPESLVAAIEAAGFDRSAIVRTRELDSLGSPVTFLEVAVRVPDGCLVGQVGDGEPLALRTDALGGGECLVGDVIGLD